MAAGREGAVMRILFSWTGVTSYMADCWRRLLTEDGVDLRVVVEHADSGKAFEAEKTLSGIDHAVVGADDPPGRWRSVLRGDWRPDVLFAGGWRSPTTRSVVAALPGVPKVFCLDMPWRWRPRCVMARFVLWRFLRRFDAVFVPGASSARYARWLGFRKDRVFKGLYAVDQSRFSSASDSGFLYVGRFSPEKRVDLVEKAYARYRELGGTWGFDRYGQGGRFVQADGMPRVYASHACLLLASAFDPWPLVMLEAKASGLEVVASDRCGNCDELGAVKVPYGDVEAMARAMLAVERGEPAAGVRRDVRIADYDCSAWAKRVVAICDGLARGEFFCPGMDDAANGMAVVARLLSSDDAFRGEYVVHGAWLPSVWLRCLAAMMRRPGGYLRMAHGAYSPVYLNGSGSMKKRIAGPVERFFLRRAKRIVVTCDAERGWVERYLGARRPPVEVVDLRRFFRLGSGGRVGLAGRAGRAMHLLYLGRRHPLKGVSHLEEAVRGLDGVELRVVTDARGEEKERVWEWCDVLCLPTLSENFGLVVAEALERGKRVITTDGAPAWADEARVDAEGRLRLAYLDGYCGASGPERVRMLRDAIAAMEAGRRADLV